MIITKVKNRKGLARKATKPRSLAPKTVSAKKRLSAPYAVNTISNTKPFQVVKELTLDFDLSAKDMAGVLDVTPKTFSRWKGNGNAMSEQQADRMLILKSIFDLGRKVLGSDSSVKQWIREPIFLLDGQIPLKLLKTESGRRKVESVLHQIEYGFF